MSCNFQEILRDSSANSPVISRCPDSGKRQHPTRPINYAERKRVTGDGYFRFPAYSIIPASSQLFRHNTEASMATTNLSYNRMNILRIKGGRGGGGGLTCGITARAPLPIIFNSSGALIPALLFLPPSFSVCSVAVPLYYHLFIYPLPPSSPSFVSQTSVP